jgi:hypothetical protein
MKKDRPKIAFDLDGTLITYNDLPNYHVIDLLLWFHRHSIWDIYIWSGGGLDYAQQWTRKLGLDGMVKVIEKFSIEVDIAVDDRIGDLDKKGLKSKAIITVTPRS